MRKVHFVKYRSGEYAVYDRHGARLGNVWKRRGYWDGIPNTGAAVRGQTRQDAALALLALSDTPR